MADVNYSNIVLIDKEGNKGFVRSLTNNDINKIKQVISDAALIVDPESHELIKATTTALGVVQLADAAAIAAGTEGRIVDAKQLKAVSDRMVNGVHYRGSVEEFSDLPTENVEAGDMYNVKAAFVQGGISYPAGTNVVADMSGETVAWDVLDGDPSGFAKQAVANTFTAANDFTAGSITVPTKEQGDNSTNAASTAYVDTAIGNLQDGIVFSAAAEPQSVENNTVTFYPAIDLL
jgi:hypothetical protein